MSQELSVQNEKQLLLEQDIFAVEQEIIRTQNQLEAFKTKLRTRFIEEIVEEQELSDLYRQKQKEKKAKRKIQKQKGKNYQEPEPGIEKSKNHQVEEEEGELISFDSEADKKKLYRECMLLVHPDNFSMQEEKEELANELTSELIKIYKTGTVKELRNFKSHILAGNTNLVKDKQQGGNSEKFAHLEATLTAKQKELEQLKSAHLYKVITEYTNPEDYFKELDLYFKDRLAKLRKRLRIK